jgi:hypothetical protein
MGLAFAAAGWCQLAVGLAALTRPVRRWALVAVATNAVVFIGTWVVRRTVGLPTWTGDGGVQDPALADLVCVQTTRTSTTASSSGGRPWPVGWVRG